MMDIFVNLPPYGCWLVYLVTLLFVPLGVNHYAWGSQLMCLCIMLMFPSRKSKSRVALTAYNQISGAVFYYFVFNISPILNPFDQLVARVYQGY
ncbi:hypothetical protein BKA67DRAFT_556065 [Truncatella angustata]|uniref:Uncharacterized protein n=1 Tax=Truncatella angustata TaxID=152316 RepID=A0A9P8UST0_9PEZI|nr:uncharacterized protein BKA67DRAFT_556065 [Truncatella angustata]KAH6657688.1 hypothetical protein BKA67DRAFT_556065 [Truncatella angustata]